MFCYLRTYCASLIIDFQFACTVNAMWSFVISPRVYDVIASCVITVVTKYVTGFGKTDHVCTRIEIHFIAYYNSHTQALSRYSDTIATDKKVCFYRCLFVDLIKPCRTITDPVGPLGGLIRWHVVPNCSTQRLLSSWYGKGCHGHLSGPLCTQLGCLCLRASLTHLPWGIHDISGSVQNISQNQPVHPVAM